MVDTEIIPSMKKRIDELTDDEIIIIKDYCEQKVLQIHQMKEQEYKQSSLAGAMLLGMFKSAGL